MGIATEMFEFKCSSAEGVDLLSLGFWGLLVAKLVDVFSQGFWGALAQVLLDGPPGTASESAIVSEVN